jgi:hypothetical protein
MPDSSTRGESANRGESRSADRSALARRLEAAGHGGCASDLEAADDRDVVTVAYAIVQHIEENYEARREEDELIAQDLKDWADRHDRELRGTNRAGEGHARRSR